MSKIYLNILFFCLFHTVFALSINRKSLQKPLSLPISFHPTSAILAITEIDSDRERWVELPLGQRTSPDADLPHHLKSAKIVALVNTEKQAAPLEQLSRTVCRVVPDLRFEEKDVMEKEKDWPWFRLEDGEVTFEQETSRWTLNGSEIGYYECK